MVPWKKFYILRLSMSEKRPFSIENFVLLCVVCPFPSFCPAWRRLCLTACPCSLQVMCWRGCGNVQLEATIILRGVFIEKYGQFQQIHLFHRDSKNSIGWAARCESSVHRDSLDVVVSGACEWGIRADWSKTPIAAAWTFPTVWLT